MESSRGRTVLQLLSKWRKQGTSIRISLRPVPTGSDCFVVEFTGVLAIEADTAAPNEFGFAVGEDVPVLIDLAGGHVNDVLDEEAARTSANARRGSFFDVRLRDGSRCLVREILTAKGIH